VAAIKNGLPDNLATSSVECRYSTSTPSAVLQKQTAVVITLFFYVFLAAIFLVVLQYFRSKFNKT